MTGTRTSLALAAAFLLASASGAAAQTRIVNLSDKDLFVATYTYQPYSSNSGGLAVITEEGWYYSGWWKVAPGDTYQGAAGNYHVEQGQKPVTWNNTKKSGGLIKRDKFNVFLPKNGYADEHRKQVRNGYEAVEFQQLNGTYTHGAAYRLESKEFDINIESRSIKFLLESYKVPGKVAYYTSNVQVAGGKDVGFSQGEKSVGLGGSIEGEQVRPFGPREPGWVKGKLTVYYTERK